MNKTEIQNYIDVTKNWFKNATPNSHQVKDQLYFDYRGQRYHVDNKNVVLDYSKEELETAYWLENIFGGEIFMLPRINIPKGIETADYLWHKEYWDLKTISEKATSQKRAVDNIIKTSKNQTSNFILNITNSKINKKILLEQTKRIFNTNGREWINTIIIVDNKKVLKIYQRIK